MSKINEIDTYGLLDFEGIPEDEYSVNAGKIAGLMMVAKDLNAKVSVDDLSCMIISLFEEAFEFDDWLTEEDCVKCAVAILETWKKYQEYQLKFGQ